jgi:ABC-type Fe3+/spermidine/putrescine transport system ATPase subunit
MSMALRSPLDISVTVARRGFDVVADLSLEPGERLAMFGPSGAGKTTIVDTVAGLTDPTRGAVRLGEEVLSRTPSSPSRWGRLARTLNGVTPTDAAVRHVSLVRQPPALFPHLDVEANIAYGRSDPHLVHALLDRLELSKDRRARPGDLSGGQVQRVALGRALARPHSVLLLDEPVSALDPRLRALCLEVVAERCQQEDAAAVLVTHDLHEAQSFGGKMAVIDRGTILALGDPHEVVAAPPSRRVAELVGYRSFLRLRHASGSAGEVELAVDDSCLRLAEDGQAAGDLTIAGRAVSCVPMGSRFVVTLAVEAGTTVDLTFRGRWVTVLTCNFAILVTTPITLGKEILATTSMPPVVARGAEVRGSQGGFRGERGETAIR